MSDWTLERILAELMDGQDRAVFFSGCARAVRRQKIEFDALLLKCLIRATGLRRDSLVRKLQPARVAELVQQRLSWPEMAHGVHTALVVFHLENRKELLSYCLDRWGIEHRDGSIHGAAVAPSPEDARTVFDEAVARFPARHVWTYFASQGLLGDGAWRAATWPLVPSSPDTVESKGTAVLAAAEATGRGVPIAPPVDADPTLPAVAPAAPEEVAQEAGHDPTPTAVSAAAEVARLGTLDRVLITEAVRAVAGETGAMTVEHIEDAIDELVGANSRRYQSYYHRGFLDSLLGRPIRLVGPEMNELRKVWVLAGYVTARVRANDALGVIDTVKANIDVFAALGHPGAVGAAESVVALVIEAYDSAGQHLPLAEVLTPDVAAAAGRKAWELLLAIARDLYRSRKNAESDRFLDILEDAVAGAYVPLEFVVELQRRRAQCRKAFGAFADAIAAFDALLPNCGAGNRSSVLCDIGLAQGAFRWLVEVRIPTDRNQAGDMLRRIELGKPRYTEALACLGADDANAPFVLGIAELLGVVDGRAGHSAATAQDMLQLAYERAIRRLSIYRSTGVLGWIQFAYACSIFRNLDATLFDTSLQILRSCAEDLPAAQWPRWFVEVCIAEALEFDYDELSRLVHLLDEVAPAILDDYLDHRMPDEIPARLLRHPACIARLDSLARNDARTPDVRWRAALSALRRWHLAAGTTGWDADGHTEAAERVLELARVIPAVRPRLSELLASGERFEGVWSLADRLEAQAALASWDERQEDALAYLQSACRAHRAEGDQEGLEAVVGQMLEMAPEHPATLEAAAMLPQVAPDDSRAVPGAGIGRAVRILFVGGNETQEQYGDGLREELERGRPPVHVDFEFTGWTSNWGAHLDRIVPRLGDYDGVVIMQFVRTNFGRKLNAEISKQNSAGASLVWRRCTGHGRKSMLLAIKTCAAAVVAMHERSAGGDD